MKQLIILIAVVASLAILVSSCKGPETQAPQTTTSETRPVVKVDRQGLLDLMNKYLATVPSNKFLYRVCT